MGPRPVPPAALTRGYKYRLAAADLARSRANWELPVDGDYLAGVDRDMSRAGLRPLGWSPASRRQPVPYKQLPEPDQMDDSSFVQRFQPIATRLRTALAARPADRN